MVIKQRHLVGLSPVQNKKNQQQGIGIEFYIVANQKIVEDGQGIVDALP